MSLRYILTLPSHLCLGIPNNLFPEDLCTKTLNKFLLSPISALCHAQLILPDLITLITFGETTQPVILKILPYLTLFDGHLFWVVYRDRNPWWKETEVLKLFKWNLKFVHAGTGSGIYWQWIMFTWVSWGINLTLRLLMSYIYGAPILDVSRSHTTTHHSR